MTQSNQSAKRLLNVRVQIMGEGGFRNAMAGANEAGLYALL